MKVFVKAKPNAKENKIEKVEGQPNLFGDKKVTKQDFYKISVKELPIGGRANKAITNLLSEYFKVPPSCVVLISGATSKNKTFEIK